MAKKKVKQQIRVAEWIFSIEEYDFSYQNEKGETVKRIERAIKSSQMICANDVYDFLGIDYDKNKLIKYLESFDWVPVPHYYVIKDDIYVHYITCKNIFNKYCRKYGEKFNKKSVATKCSEVLVCLADGFRGSDLEFMIKSFNESYPEIDVVKVDIQSIINEPLNPVEEWLKITKS